MIARLFIFLAVGSFSARAADVWPEKDWTTATPASQGLSTAGLDEATAYAEKYGGGSGCVIRHGYLVKEWGSTTTRWDIKSATKGTLGATTLGLAVDAEMIKLDDLAQKHYQSIGTEKPDNSKDWLKEITVRHLATMTAGFDDGRPPNLVYRPGTRGIYSNDTSNMLAELLTLKFGEDLSAVVKRQVMDPIGVPTDNWRWRANQYRAKTIQDLPSREFASGLTITHRALARIGYLYLREGRWKDRQILSREYIRTATTPTKLSAPFAYYAFYWGSNALGTYAGMPSDAYWALGLGDSFVVVSPSLDIVAVRLGVGSKKSQLPGGDDDWGKRVEGLFRLMVTAVEDKPPPSPVIKEVRWAPADTIIRMAKGSDNWPMTWADDDDALHRIRRRMGVRSTTAREVEPGVREGTRDSPGRHRSQHPVPNRRTKRRRAKGEKGERAAIRGRDALHVGAQRGQCAARVVRGSRKDVDVGRLETLHKLRLPDVSELRQGLHRGPRRVRLHLLARRGRGVRAGRPYGVGSRFEDSDQGSRRLRVLSRAD